MDYPDAGGSGIVDKVDRSTILDIAPNRWDTLEADLQMAEAKRRITDLEDRMFRAARGQPTTGNAGTTIINNILSKTDLSKIILYHLEEFSIYSAVESGLIQAMAKAVVGDSVWLTSKQIDMTAALTVTPGVALIGIDHQAKLAFTGFDGTALTVGEDALLCGVSLSMVGLGVADCVGVDARNSGAFVDDCDVEVSGGLTNTRYRWGA